DTKSYKNMVRWTAEIAERNAVQRGRKVNRAWGEDWEQVKERHSAADIDNAGSEAAE
ncbi:MAG: glutathione-dependent disulfide-bond oxidoreductase, partial [Pseudomonadota bacterium]